MCRETCFSIVLALCAVADGAETVVNVVTVVNAALDKPYKLNTVPNRTGPDSCGPDAFAMDTALTGPTKAQRGALEYYRGELTDGHFERPSISGANGWVHLPNGFSVETELPLSPTIVIDLRSRCQAASVTVSCLGGGVAGMWLPEEVRVWTSDTTDQPAAFSLASQARLGTVSETGKRQLAHKIAVGSVNRSARFVKIELVNRRHGPRAVTAVDEIVVTGRAE